MALAKDPQPYPYDSQMALVQACTNYGNMFGGPSAQVVSDQSSPELCVFNEHHHKAVTEEGETPVKASGLFKNFAKSRSCSLSSPISSTNSNLYGAANYQAEEDHAVINFKCGYNNFMHNTSGSFLSFEQNDPNPQNSYHQDGDYSICWEDFNCVQSAASSIKENQHRGETFGWPISESNAEFETQEACFNKRPHTGESMQALKKQCNSATRKPKPKSTPSKDPQSIAAKNRRERISERLKVLQELVPNGSKVDLVTMLEKAISYVKFLQLQVKVLAADEFWPVQGRKAPDLSQVKEAIDAILNSSQKDRNSSSK